MTNNIINFPNIRKERLIQKELELEELTDDIVTDVFSFLIENDMDVSHEDYVYDISMVFEAMRSLIYKIHDLHHPLQILCQDMYKYHPVDLEERQLEFDF